MVQVRDHFPTIFAFVRALAAVGDKFNFALSAKFTIKVIIVNL
jgi:hypothetical protein